MDGLEYISFNI